MLDELDEDTAGSARMDKCDAPVDPTPRDTIDQLHTLLLQTRQLGLDVAHGKGDVME